MINIKEVDTTREREDTPLLHPEIPRHSDDGEDGTNECIPETKTPLYRLTVLVWVSMLSFGMFAAFQYVLPVVFGQHWHRWNKTDPGLYRDKTPFANVIMIVHLTCGVYLMTVGPIQLIPHIRRKYLDLHRWTGRIYIGAVLLLTTCTTIFVLRYRTSRDWIHEDIGNVIFGSAGFYSALQSYKYVAISKDIMRHKLWSWRLFAVIFGAAWYRIYSWPVFLIFQNCTPNFFTNLTFYLIFPPFWLLIELIWHQDYWESTLLLLPIKADYLKDALIQVAFVVLLSLMLPVFLLTWVPSALNLPTVQQLILKKDEHAVDVK